MGLEGLGEGWTEVTEAQGWGEERQRPWGGTGRKGSQSERQAEGGAHRSQGGRQKTGLARQAGMGTLGASRRPTCPETVLTPGPQAHLARTEPRKMDPDFGPQAPPLGSGGLADDPEAPTHHSGP